jgi:hypothetical protein
MVCGSMPSGSFVCVPSRRLTAPRILARHPVALNPAGLEADLRGMGRSVIGLCAGFGGFVGGYVPVLWGASSFSLVSIVFGFFGAAAGVWLGVRVSDV